MPVCMSLSFLTKFSTKTGYCNAEVGGQAGAQAGVTFWFLLKNLGLLWLIDVKLGVWVAIISGQLGIATEVSVFKVKVKVNVAINISYPELFNWVGYVKKQLGIATQISVKKVKVTVA